MVNRKSTLETFVKIVILATITQIRDTCVKEIAYVLPGFNIFKQFFRPYVDFVAKVDHTHKDIQWK